MAEVCRSIYSWAPKVPACVTAADLGALIDLLPRVQGSVPVHLGLSALIGIFPPLTLVQIMCVCALPDPVSQWADPHLPWKVCQPGNPVVSGF